MPADDCPPAPAAFLNLAIVGTGPTGLYTLHHLLQSDRPLTVTLFETARLAGVGSPYSPEATASAMLANIASIEIPPLTEPYLDWLQRQPPALLALHGADPDRLHDRQFLPRLLLGAWFRDALEAMLADAARRGHRVALHEATEVLDVAPAGPDLRVTFATPGGSDSHLFSHVVLATGHRWPEAQGAGRHHYVSPWTGLLDAVVPAARVGVLGTSLSAIDAAMAVACQHGRFGPGDRDFTLAPGSDGLAITLMSRQGLLPEADFWCPLPYQPLRHATPDALAREAAAGADGLLDRAWRLIVAELAAADPAWTEALGIAHLPPEGFAEAYFAPRLAQDPFAAAAANLAEVARNARDRRTVGWRYAILRMHEPVQAIVPRLTEADRARFGALKRVFIDNYAAVPPQSIRRLLALHRAGCLSVLALGEEYGLDHHAARTRVTPEGGAPQDFDVFIDARGQQALGAEDMPFPSLRTALPGGEIAMDDRFALTGVGGGRIFLPAAPYLLTRLPFVQGITASADMGAAVAEAILSAETRAATPAEAR
jgi:uncharacterized NAD(P)/FAD-binding protein YdhS